MTEMENDESKKDESTTSGGDVGLRPLVRCVSHHYACDCREAHFEELKRELDSLRNGSGNPGLKRVPYPIGTADELAECLIQHGLIDCNAWHDAEGYDGGIVRDRIYKMQAACVKVTVST